MAREHHLVEINI